MCEQGYSYEYYDSELNHYHVSVEVFEELPSFSVEYDTDKKPIKTLSTHSSLDTMESYAVTIHDLEEKGHYEIEWSLGNNKKYMRADLEEKIVVRNSSQKNTVRNSKGKEEIDLVFRQNNTNKYFTIHCDLIEQGIVQFYPIRINTNKSYNKESSLHESLCTQFKEEPVEIDSLIKIK